MKIKVAKDYSFDQMIYEYDRQAYWDYGPYAKTFKTIRSDYSSKWEVEDVTIEQLQSYIDKGYAIKINC